MVRPPDKAVRVLRAAPGEDGAAWAAVAMGVVGRERDRAATVLKDDAGTTVWRARINGREVVVKCWALSAGARLKSLLGASRGFRHWRGAGWLAKHGFGTARCFALVRGRRDGAVVECLVMEALPGKSVLQHLADGDLGVREEHSIARELARLTDAMLRAGRWNRDHKPSNLLVTGFDGDRARIAIIDCVGIRFGGPLVAMTRGKRMTLSLVLEPLGVGCLPRRVLLARYCGELLDLVLARAYKGDARDYRRDRRQWFTRHWRWIEWGVRRHGDPTPRVNPLR